MLLSLNPYRPVIGLDSNSERDLRIHTIILKADFSHLAQVALQARRTQDDLPQLPSQLTATFNLTQFMSGHNNLVLELKFSDNLVWLARIHLGMEEQTPEDMISEIATMRLVHARTTIPVPKVYAFDASVNNAFGYPYTLMEYLPGKRTRAGLVASVPMAHRSKVARQIANILLELSQIKFDRIGRLIPSGEEQLTIIGSKYHYNTSPMATSLEYFYSQRYGENQEIYEIHKDDVQWNTACWILSTSLTHLIIPDPSNGPFPLSHQDLHFGNILFDDDFNISGVIDWSSAQIAPLEDLCVLPDFAVYKDRGDLAKEVQDFKDLLIQEIQDLSAGISPCNPLAPYMTAYMSSNQSELNSCLRMKSAAHALDAAGEFIKAMCGTTISWEQFVEVYGKLPAPRRSLTS